MKSFLQTLGLERFPDLRDISYNEIKMYKVQTLLFFLMNNRNKSLFPFCGSKRSKLVNEVY
ncbi:MAG: hypothetical protein SCALA701_36010 [Candidatus Scalindua sp.]|nr:MAG: hypothetical protein SCALA701_36010 [Candidatus Scalindua sp.]